MNATSLYIFQLLSCFLGYILYVKGYILYVKGFQYLNVLYSGHILQKTGDIEFTLLKFSH